MTTTVAEMVDGLTSAGLIARRVGPASGAELVDLTHDSRTVEPGWVFCAIPGARHDGHDHAPAAVEAGAAALVVERPLDLGVPQVVVDDSRRAMGPAAAVVHGHPSARLDVIGVTGTNGKSSVVQVLADIFTAAGRRAELYGTLTGARTTPEAGDLQRRLAASLAAGTDLVAMEVSSHALALHRVDGIRFAAAVFTNLGRDHLDFHRTVDAYFEAKAQLFRNGRTPVAVVNVDDPHGRRLADEIEATDVALHRYRLADARPTVTSPVGTRITWRGQTVDVPLLGEHNVSNVLAAATTAVALGVEPAVVARGLAATRPVRGRFEVVDAGQPFTVVIDYAHTPDALAAALAAARQVADGRVVVVFGCGGDRDHEKRPEMGRVVERAADLGIVTSDNPRHEDPASIIADITAGLDGAGAEMQVIADRRDAIVSAIGQACPGDVVVLAGKGHETVQVIGDLELPFDDRAVALDVLGARP